MKSCGYEAHFEERERNSVSFGLQLCVSGWKHFSSHSRLRYKSGWSFTHLRKREYSHDPPTWGKRRQRRKAVARCHAVAQPSHRGKPGVSPPLGDPRVSPLRRLAPRMNLEELPRESALSLMPFPNSRDPRCSMGEGLLRGAATLGDGGVSSELNELTQLRSAAG